MGCRGSFCARGYLVSGWSSPRPATLLSRLQPTSPSRAQSSALSGSFTCRVSGDDSRRWEPPSGAVGQLLCRLCQAEALLPPWGMEVPVGHPRCSALACSTGTQL